VANPSSHRRRGPSAEPQPDRCYDAVVRPLPLISLGVALAFAALAWARRRDFGARPYFHWFLYLHLAAVGLHQFEEYGWPGGFREAFVGVFGFAEAAAIVPSATSLELLNAFGLTALFGVVGWLGTRVVWVGLALLFVNFGNAFFHLVASVTRMEYVPGVVTATLLYLPLALLATRHVVVRNDVTAPRLLFSFALGTAASFAPFLHVWALHSLGR
jgi:hypothetical protein